MNSLTLTSSSEFATWLTFLAMIFTVGLGIAGFIFWSKMFGGSKRKHHKKNRKQRRHKRQHNPTLAQVGGLPPKRDDDQPAASP